MVVLKAGVERESFGLKLILRRNRRSLSETSLEGFENSTAVGIYLYYLLPLINA